MSYNQDIQANDLLASAQAFLQLHSNWLDDDDFVKMLELKINKNTLKKGVVNIPLVGVNWKWLEEEVDVWDEEGEKSSLTVRENLVLDQYEWAHFNDKIMHLKYWMNALQIESILEYNDPVEQEDWKIWGAMDDHGQWTQEKINTSRKINRQEWNDRLQEWFDEGKTWEQWLQKEMQEEGPLRVSKNGPSSYPWGEKWWSCWNQWSGVHYRLDVEKWTALQEQWNQDKEKIWLKNDSQHWDHPLKHPAQIKNACSRYILGKPLEKYIQVWESVLKQERQSTLKDPSKVMDIVDILIVWWTQEDVKEIKLNAQGALQWKGILQELSLWSEEQNWALWTEKDLERIKKIELLAQKIPFTVPSNPPSGATSKEKEEALRQWEKIWLQLHMQWSSGKDKGLDEDKKKSIRL